MKIQIAIFMFLFISAFLILGNNNLHIQNSSDLLTLGNLYYSWIGSVFNQGIQITGYVAHAGWLPKENISSLNVSK